MDKQTGGNPQLGPPQFNYELEGQVANLFEGLSPAELDQIKGDLEAETTAIQAEENAVEELAKAEIQEEPIAPVNREEPEDTPEPEPAPAAVPPALKFNIKRHGQEIELDLSNDQERMKTLVQLGYDYQAKTSELAREREWLQAHKAIWESEDFQGFLAEKRAEGKFLPPAPPAVEPQSLSEYAIRQLDPDFDVVRERMSAVVMNLDPEVERAVRTNHAAFVKLYDRVAQDVRTRSTPQIPPPASVAPKAVVTPTKAPAAPVDATVQKKILQSKEVLKDRGKVESPGGVTEPPTEKAAWKKQDALLARRFRESRSDDDAAALLLHRQLIRL